MTHAIVARSKPWSIASIMDWQFEPLPEPSTLTLSRECDIAYAKHYQNSSQYASHLTVFRRPCTLSAACVGRGLKITTLACHTNREWAISSTPPALHAGCYSPGIGGTNNAACVARFEFTAPSALQATRVGNGRLAQLAERQLYTLDVTGSSPVSPTPDSHAPACPPECERK